MNFSLAGFLPEEEYKWLCVSSYSLLQLFCKISLLLLGPVLDCLVHSLKEAQPRSHSGSCAAESLGMEREGEPVCASPCPVREV